MELLGSIRGQKLYELVHIGQTQMAVLQKGPTSFKHGLGNSVSSVSLLTLTHGHNLNAWDLELLGVIIDNLGWVTTFRHQIEDWLSLLGDFEDRLDGVRHGVDESLSKRILDEHS